MPKMSNQEIMDKVRKWQASAPFEDVLRCNNDNCWDILEPVIVRNDVVLRCIHCKAIMPQFIIEGMFIIPRP